MKYMNWEGKKGFFGYLIICLLSLVIIVLFSGNVYTEGDDALFIDEKGNVGIGTRSPKSPLSVSGGAAIGLDYVGQKAPDNGLIVQGQIGIGTTEPKYPLDVDGFVSAHDFKLKGSNAESSVKQFLVPRGAIIAWCPPASRIKNNQITAPEGWALCDGKNNDTPNLSGKFIMGAATTNDIGNEGGEEKHSHTGITDPYNYSEYKFSWKQKNGDVADPKHTHEFKTNSVEHYPPYYTVVFIMKL